VPAPATLHAADAPGREAAAVVAAHPEQGWSLRGNGVVLFEDTGLLPHDGQAIPPHRSASHGAAGRMATAGAPQPGR